MNEEKLEQFKENLLKLKVELTRMLESQDKPMELRDAFDDADITTNMMEKMINALVSSNYEKNLERVEAALERIQEGQFGKCLVCGSEIPLGRLEALPFTLYCIDCQKEIERKRELIRDQTITESW
ncbi:MAG: TraR/DksA family transcriptional regulator [Candidatus Aminicenantes bacterium]|nr:MAG: TraR/DksA family transcriptional regulator [Candidatus Aminicenantes bacterium]